MSFFVKQKTAYEMRISDWSSDVCSSDLGPCPVGPQSYAAAADHALGDDRLVVDSADRGRGDHPAAARRTFATEQLNLNRPEERRVGQASVSTCRTRGSTYHYKNRHTRRYNLRTQHIKQQF